MANGRGFAARLGLFVRFHFAEDTNHLINNALFVGNGYPLCRDRHHCAIPPDDAQLKIKRLVHADGVLNAGGHMGHVIRVIELDAFF